jgi:NAD-dependent SIR2 family protein deacetylase
LFLKVQADVVFLISSGLSQRANHPSNQLHLLHGTLFDLKCTNFYCDYIRRNDFTDPIVPALDIPKKLSGLSPSGTDKSGEEAAKAMREALGGIQNEVDISDASNPIPELSEKDLPQCPKCNDGLLRPGVVWFGEALPEKTISAVEKWIAAGPVDLCLVIGTSAQVYPAAGYVHKARMQGARIAVCNMDPRDTPGKLSCDDWFFSGDAGVVVPEILKSVIGDLDCHLGNSN